MEKKIEEILNKFKTPTKFKGHSTLFLSNDGALKAMSEYAQLESIEFDEWKIKNDAISCGNGWRLSNIEGIKTPSELYQIFKQEQQTTK